MYVCTIDQVSTHTFKIKKTYDKTERKKNIFTGLQFFCAATAVLSAAVIGAVNAVYFTVKNSTTNVCMEQ